MLLFTYTVKPSPYRTYFLYGLAVAIDTLYTDMVKTDRAQADFILHSSLILDKYKQVDIKPAGQPEQASLNE